VTPGEEGKWFAAAKDAKLFDKAIALANLTPCSPQRLTRAARDFADANPTFALEAGVTAIRWLAHGHGYEVSALDVRDAHTHTMSAARRAGRADEVRSLIRHYVTDRPRREFMTSVLGRELGARVTTARSIQPGQFRSRPGSEGGRQVTPAIHMRSRPEGQSSGCRQRSPVNRA